MDILETKYFHLIEEKVVTIAAHPSDSNRIVVIKEVEHGVLRSQNVHKNKLNDYIPLKDVSKLEKFQLYTFIEHKENGCIFMIERRDIFGAETVVIDPKNTDYEKHNNHFFMYKELLEDFFILKPTFVRDIDLPF